MKKALKYRSLKLLASVLLGVSLLTGAASISAKAAETPSDIQQAASILRGRGVYQGDASGDLKLGKGLTRAELAAILTRMNDEVTDPSVFEAFCWDTFQDLPQWAKPYVGYCIQWGLMFGYDSAHFGPNDAVNPKMACTVVLRSCGYESSEGKDWTYNTAAQYAASLGLIDASTVNAATMTRGDMAVLLCRASKWMDKSSGQSQTTTPTAAQTTTPAPASQEAFEITADGKYIVHADHWSREDFSQKANPAVFKGVYTRELYNAIRQTIVDGGPGEQPAFTTAAISYNDVDRLFSYMCGGAPTYGRYSPEKFNFPDHCFAVNSWIPESMQAPLEFIQPVVEHVNTLSSDSEKVRYLNDYLCSLMTYGKSDRRSAVFAPHSEEVKGTCGAYASNFQTLCQAADIPCISIVSEEADHAWNMVYADGQWLHVDVSANDTNSIDFILLTKDYPADGYNDSYPEITAFLQELLVPGSSAK